MPSSVIAKIEYDEKNEILEIIFLSGSVYHYLNVPEEIFAAMKKATSKGTFLNKFIKGHFQFRKISKGELISKKTG